MKSPPKPSKKGRVFSHPLFVDNLSNRPALDLAIKHFKTLVKEYEEGEGIKVFASSFLFADIIRAFSRDIKKLINVDAVSMPSEFRIAGLLAFWIRKLKPLHDIEKTTGDKTESEIEQLRLYLNEQFALNVGLSALSGYGTDGSAANLKLIISSEGYSDILSHLRYRAISPQAMSLYYKFLVDIRISLEESITKLVTALEYRDDDTGNHVKRIGDISSLLAETLNLPPYMVKNLRFAAMMHDIGKIGIDDSILKNPNRLNDTERALMQKHSIIGEKILANSSSPVMSLAKVIAYSHHEKWDGTGYPDGLAGDNIPIEARIVALADAFDAMMSKRVYQPSKGRNSSLQEVKDQSGRQFDPRICDAFFKVTEKILSFYPSESVT